jgi:hypothetical protein
MKLSADIKPGTIGLVQTLKSKRKWLTKGIQIAEGSPWNHAFIVVESDGKLYAFEQGTIWGAIFTPLEEYLNQEEKGEVKLAWKNLRDYDTRKNALAIAELALSLSGRRMYNIWTIFKMIPRQLLQQVGIDYKFKTKPLKHGFVCSVMVCYMLYQIYGVFKDWQWYAPDDIYTDTQFTYFVQP